MVLPSPAGAEVELRTEAALQLRLAKPLELRLNEELRVDMRQGEPRSWLQSVVLRIRPVKWLRIEPQYRIGCYSGGSLTGVDWRHRLGLAVRGRFKLGPVRLGVRERYQVRFRKGDDPPRQHLVSKVEAKVRHKSLPFEPSVWLEFFLRLPENEDPVLADKLRVGVGLDLPAGLCDLALEVQLEKSIKKPDEAPVPIISMNFVFELDVRSENN